MKIYRTTEGTIFEIVCAAILIILWIIVGCYCFGSQANLTSGARTSVLTVAVLGTLAVIITLVSAYKPEQMINLPIRLKSPRQFETAVRLTRIVAIEEALILLCAVPLAAHPDQKALYQTLVYCLAGVLIATVLVGTFLIFKRK